MTNSDQYVVVATQVTPRQLQLTPRLEGSKRWVGREVYKLLLKAEGDIGLTFNASLARAFGGPIQLDQLTHSFPVEGVVLDQGMESECCDRLAQYIAEAVHDVWVAYGKPNDWFSADIEYLEGEELPTLGISGFTLTFRKEGPREESKAAPAPMCEICGHPMEREGRFFRCPNCGCPSYPNAEI